MTDSPRVLLLTDNSILTEATESEDLKFNINVVHWSESVGLSADYDVAIIDGLVPKEKLRIHDNTHSAALNFNHLERNVRVYLKSGGCIVFLNYPAVEFSVDGSEANMISSHAWLQALHLPEPKEVDDICSIGIVSGNERVKQYLKFVDETQVLLSMSEDVVSGEELAVDRDTGATAAMAVSRYKDAAEYQRGIEGKIVFLPRLTSYAANPVQLLNSMARIGLEYSPRGFDSAQRRLPEFREYGLEKEKENQFIIDTQLSDRCLSKYERTEYTDAVATAGSILEDRVRDLVSPDLADEYGHTLMTDAFSPNGGPLQLAERDDEQRGVMFMFAGTMSAIRNVAAHNPNGGDDVIHNFTRERTRAILFFVDYLLDLLDEYEEGKNGDDDDPEPHVQTGV